LSYRNFIANCHILNKADSLSAKQLPTDHQVTFIHYEWRSTVREYPGAHFMLLLVASLKQATSRSEFSLPRDPGQTLIDYATHELRRRVKFVTEKIIDSTKLKDAWHEKSETLIFTLPEFFWNIPWKYVMNREELGELTTLYFTKIAESINEIMENVPKSQYGNIILLGGTVAALIEIEASHPSYEAINYIPVADNYRKTTSDGMVPMSTWPKRHTSHIDFGTGSTWDGKFYSTTFPAPSHLTVRVKEKNISIAENNSDKGFDSVFFNTLIPDCPISINLCLDYAKTQFGDRDIELENTQSKVDFLIACGMPFNNQKIYPKNVQFAVRNDGIGEGHCQAVSVKDNKIVSYPFPMQRMLFNNTIHIAGLEIA